MKKIIFLGFFIRIIIVLLSLNLTNFDLSSYLKIGRLTLQGINIYPEIARVHHPYLPFFLYIEAAAVFFSRFINPLLFIKTLIIVLDCAIIYLIYLLSNKNLKSALLYAINPVVVLISSFHGQFDSIPLFFILVSVYLLKEKKEFIAILSLSFAVLVKTWPVFFIIPFLRKIKNKILWLFIGIFPLIFLFTYSLIFKAKIADIFFTVLKHHSLYAIFGLGKIISLVFGFFRLETSILEERIFFIIFAFSFLIFSVLNKRSSITKELLLLMFFFYSFTTNFAVQYFLWIVPFLILLKPKYWVLLNILMTIYLLINYASWYFKFDLSIILTSTGLLLWLIFLKSFVDIEKKILNSGAKT